MICLIFFGSSDFPVGKITHGDTGHLRAALGSAFKIGEIKEGKPELQVRMILGVGF